MNTTEIILARSLAATAAVASGSHLSRASRVSSTRRSSRSSAAASPASVAPAVAPAAVAPAAAAAARRRRPSSSSSSRPVRFLAPAVLIAAAALLAPKASADQTITSPATWANNYVVGSGTAETVTITGAAALLTTGANVHVGGNVNTTGSTPSSGTLILTEGGRLTGVTLLHLAGTGTTAAANVVSTAVGRIIIGSEDGTAMAGTFAGTGTLEIRGHAPGTQSAPNSLVWFNYVGSSYYMNKGGLSTGANIVLTGATSVKHSSAGTTTLSLGTHSYTGVTLIEKGTLVMRGEKTGQGKTIIAASGTLQVGVGTSSSAAMGEWRGSIENAGNLKFIRSNGFDFTAALIPTITGSGNINFEKTGTAGTLSIRSLIDGATNVTVNGVGAVSIIGTMQNVGTVTIDSRGATSIAALNNVGTVNVYSSAATTISGAQTNVGSYYINSIATTTISNLGTSAANITKFGAGLLSITGVTSGTVTLNGGVLTFTGGTTWVNPAAIITSAGTSLQINRSILNGTTISSVISGGGTLVKQGTASTLGAVNNSVMLSGANTYSGGTRFVGWLYLTGAGTLGTGEVLFAASAARLSLGLNNTDNYNVPITTPLPNTFDGTTAGYGGILKRGTGEVTLTGDIGLKKYIAVLEVNGGILRLGDGGTPPNWGIHNTAGVFIARTAAEAAVGPEGASLVFNHDGYLYPYVRLGAASVVAGHPWRTAFHGYGNLINEGHGITVLMGYDNATDDFSGKLIAKNGTFQIGMGKDRGRVQNASYVIEESGTIAVWRRGDLWTDAQHNAVIANAISGTGTFIKMGTNFVHLTGANNTFSGTYIVEGGGLRFGSGGITNSSADFELQRTSVNAVDKTAVLVVGRSDAIMNFTGNISGVGALRKLGTSTLVLTGNNSYSGGTHIGGGTGSGYAADNVYTTNAGTIQVGNFSVNAGLTGSLGTGTILFSVSNNSNAIGKILINRNGTFEIPGNIMGGNNATAQAPATNPYSSITLSGGSTYPAGELNGVPYEAGVAGDAITILSGNNAFKGSIIVKAGRLILSGDNTKSVGYSSRYTAEPGAILQIGDGSVGGVGGRIYQTGTDTSSAGNTRLTFSGATIEINHADTLIWSRPLSGTASVSSSSDPAYPSYNVSDVSSVFAQTGSGTTILSANNTAYLGTIRIENGRLQIGGDNNLGTSSTNIIKGGTLVLAGSVTFNKNWTLAVGEQENGIEVPSALTATFGGTFSGEGGFTKLGAGTLKLNNDYALGNISVREGVLDLTAFNGDFGKAHGNNYLEGGTLKLGATYLVSGWEIAVPATGKDTIDIDFGASAVMASGMTGAGDFTITGGGTLILGENLDFPHLANLDFSGAVTIDGGQLKLTVPGALGGTVGTPSGAVHQLIDGTLTLSSATPTTYFDNWHVPGRATLQQPIINVRENDVITLSGRLTSDANAPLKFTGNPAMSA
ncbi:MAG: autotransporter-associated beta strand repeat-containing protein, partial [Puniceicoccales bacterium]|nr:autotransporter-associated beta strand repeat-containing protein [Puniceicoccales bacterium]